MVESKVHWLKEILCTIFGIEFILMGILTLRYIPIHMVEGRILFIMWMVMIGLFCIVYLLFYDKSQDKFRWRK